MSTASIVSCALHILSSTPLPEVRMGEHSQSPARKPSAQAPPATPTHRDYHAGCPDLRRARHRWRARPRPRPRLHPPGMAASSMPFSAVNWPIIASFKACETRVARESEFEDFTTLLVICPDDSTRIELNPQPTAPLPQGGFGMSLTMMSHFCSHCFYDFGNWSRTS